MKINVLIVLIIASLLISCTPGTPAQEIEVTNPVPTEVSSTEAVKTKEPVVTQEPTATEAPTTAPSETPSGCLTLLTPPNGTEIPAIGRVTFSWSPLNEATSYALSIVLPSGETVSFETKQTFREQYMEAFPPGGKYQWRVIAQERKQSEICSSELSSFSKPAYEPPRQARNDDKKNK